jgi:hypothetical protein
LEIANARTSCSLKSAKRFTGSPLFVDVTILERF